MELQKVFAANVKSLTDLKVLGAASQHLQWLNQIEDFERALKESMLRFKKVNHIEAIYSYKIITDATAGTVEIYKWYDWSTKKKLIAKYAVKK